MSENEGYIRLYRKVLDNPLVCKSPEHFCIWIYLLTKATHSNYDTIFKNKRITLKPGQLVTGRRVIAEKWGISESTVQRILKEYENAHQIEQQTSPQNRLITIVSWNDYQYVEQPFEQQVNNKRTTSEQQVNTYNNVLNDNNIYLFNNNKESDFDVYDSDPYFQEYLKTKGINNKQEFNKLTDEQQEKLSEKYVMGG